MEISITKKEFLKALYRVQNIVEIKSTNKVLESIKLESKTDSLVVNATDHAVSMEAVYEANIITPGAILVPYKKLYEIVKVLGGEVITLEKLENDFLEIQCEKVKYQINAMESLDFPPLRDLAGEDSIGILESELLGMIEDCLFTVSVDDNRPSINGILFQNFKRLPEDFNQEKIDTLMASETVTEDEKMLLQANIRTDHEGRFIIEREKERESFEIMEKAGFDQFNNYLRLVTSDGHRMTVIEKPFKGATLPEMNRGVIVPKKAFSEIKRLKEIAETDILLSFTRNEGFIRKGNTKISFSLLEGKFPDYRAILPDSFAYHIEIPRGAFHESLRRIMILMDEQYKTLRFHFRDGELRIFINNPMVGFAEDLIEIPYRGDEITVAFNGKYVMDVLQVIRSDTVIIDMKNNETPVVVRGMDNPEFRYILMPVILTDGGIA